jgi:hypothetical protein
MAEEFSGFINIVVQTDVPLKIPGDSWLSDL